MRIRKYDLPKDEILRLYFEEKLSFSEIGRLYNCHAQTICNRFKEWGIIARNISESLLGREFSWGSKISESLKGHKLSIETKRKIAQKATGRVPYNKGKRKSTHPDIIKYGVKGNRHWNWKGGISGKAKRLRQTSKYKAWRDSIFARDNYTCVICGKKGGNLVVHHLIRFSVILKLPKEMQRLFLWYPYNGWTLCEDCHKEVHGNAR